MRCKARAALVAGMILVCAISAWGQQKGQWVPGQFGLNAGVIPDAGIPYANMPINYSASQLNDSNGNRLLQNVTGTYSFWVDENILYYVSHHKILGGYFMPYIVLSYANGQLVAALPPLLPTNTSGINLNSGGSGFAETYIQPVNIGWHFAKRVDFNAGYAFVAPTGRYTAGANNNVGSGYWGNNLTSGTTLYITKNQATTANLVTDWEAHGSKTVASIPSGQLSKITLGQAFTDEWGFGQILPLKKDMSILGQLGFVGYDQWQVTANGGTYLIAGVPVPASNVPYYSVHAMGVQANVIMPAKNLLFFFKYYNEYSAKARPEGRTIVFGGSWTLQIPKPPPPKK
ncbi:MAG: transporter [Candidatus Acidiferrum sp.]